MRLDSRSRSSPACCQRRAPILVTEALVSGSAAIARSRLQPRRYFLSRYRFRRRVCRVVARARLEGCVPCELRRRMVAIAVGAFAHALDQVGEVQPRDTKPTHAVEQLSLHPGPQLADGVQILCPTLA